MEVNKLIENSFEVVGIGLETDFYYETDVIDIIRKSKNMMIWMLNKQDEVSIQLGEFKIDAIEGVYVLQRM